MTTKPSDLQTKRALYQAIHDASRPRKVRRTVDRTVLDADGNIIRTEREISTWTEPGDVAAAQWALAHRVPPEPS